MNYNHIANVTFKWPFKSFPLTDWITLSTRYTGNFDWTRAPLALVNDTLNVGNVVQNSRAVVWNGKLNFTTLYNKVPYLKKVNKNTVEEEETVEAELLVDQLEVGIPSPKIQMIRRKRR